MTDTKALAEELFNRIHANAEQGALWFSERAGLQQSIQSALDRVRREEREKRLKALDALESLSTLIQEGIDGEYAIECACDPRDPDPCFKCLLSNYTEQAREILEDK